MSTLRRPRVLVIDDDSTWLEQVPLILEDTCDVDAYETVDQGLSAIQTHLYDVALVDLNFEGDSRSGLDLFRAVHAGDSEIDVIVISGETDHRRFIEVFNAGVSQFVPKMSSIQEVRRALAECLEHRQARQQAIEQIAQGNQVPLLGDSPRMRKLRRDISRAVENRAKDILLLGETGTGKELVAQSIALQADPRRNLIALHCGAISESLAESEFFGHVQGAFTGAGKDRIGAFEAANGGFVFLDEIGELPLGQQTKLLRVLQERKVQPVGTHTERKADFRCIAATHVNLDNAVKEGRFREDLYYRIAKEVIRIPPLRERAEDIPQLVHFFMRNSCKDKALTITLEAIQILQNFSWPGNVRQLKAVVERIAAAVDGNTIREKDIYHALPEAIAVRSLASGRSLGGSKPVSALLGERERFERAIIRSQGDRTAAAELLGISRATFFRHAKQLGLVNSRVFSKDRD